MAARGIVTTELYFRRSHNSEENLQLSTAAWRLDIPVPTTVLSTALEPAQAVARTDRRAK